MLVLRGAADRGAHRAPAVAARPRQQHTASRWAGPPRKSIRIRSVSLGSATGASGLCGSAVPDCLLHSSELKTETVVRARAQQVPFIVFFIVQPTGKYGITL